MTIIKSKEDAKKFSENSKLGDQFFIDIFPVDPEEFLKKEKELIIEKEEILKIINEKFLNVPIGIEGVDLGNLNLEYPNMTALRKLTEPEIVTLGQRLGIEGVDLSLSSGENDKIVIAWFKENVWN